MKINKYNVQKKDEGATGRIQGGGLFLNSPSGNSSDVADEAKRLVETHLIFGQPFNGSQDVSGDITNAENITTEGGNITVKAALDEEGTDGGNIAADGNITAGGNITAEGNVQGVKFIGDVEADNVTTNTLKAESGTITALQGGRLDFDEANIRQAVIDMLTSVEITTEKLTVTKQAHFFELLIDKIKAAGGAILLTPADGFRVEKVEPVIYKISDPITTDPILPDLTGTVKTEQKDSTVIEGSDLIGETKVIVAYKLYWKASDGEKAISNMWQKDDQAICQTFNNATVGTSYNVSNKYYWALVTNVGTETIDGTDFHFITLSKAICDGELNPEVGDEIAMLGYRGTDDVERQSAIYLAAYNSIDLTLKAPLICQYKGINDFDLKAHKYSFFAANGSEVRGNFKLESGQTLEDFVDYKAITIVSSVVEYAEGNSGITAPTSGWGSKVPFIPPAKYLWTRTTVTYSDGTVTVGYSVAKFGSDGKKGEKGDDGNSYSGNLLLGTKNFSGEGWKNLSYWTDTKETYLGCKVMKREMNGYGIYQDYLAEAGTTYTFSAFIRSEGGDVRYYFETEGGAEITPQQKDIPESTEWTRVALTVKCTKSGVIRCRVQKAVGTGAVYVAGYKLERGENPDAVWTPEPSEMIGKDAEFYKLEPLKEYAVVDGDLIVDLKYQIIHIIGENASTVAASSGGYYVRMKDDKQTSYINLSYGLQPSYSNSSYLQQYGNNRDEDTEYFEVQLMNGSKVLDRRIVPVALAAKATLEITDRIRTTVQNNYRELKDGVTTNANNISQLEQTASGITSTVQQHTSQINTLNGTVSGHTTKISKLEQTAEGLKSTVESHTSDINGNKDSISKLEQTAEEIQLQVNNVSLRLDEKKIVLDGDTEINGSLTLDNSEQGFILKGGDAGTTYIQPQSIGTYSQFSNKSSNKTVYSNSIRVQISSATAEVDPDLQYKTYSGQYSGKKQLGTISSGTYLQFTDQSLTYSANDGGTVSNGQITYTLYRGQTAVKTFNTTTKNISGNIFTYTTEAAGEYSLGFTIYFSATREKKQPTSPSDMMQPELASITVNGTFKFAVVLPTTAFMLIGYDGLAVNFGNNKTAYIGKDETTIRYGNNALKVCEAGLQKLDPNGSGKWTSLDTKKVKLITTNYTLEDDVDFLVFTSSSADITVTMPSTAVTGRMVYFKDRNNKQIKVTNSSSRLMSAGSTSSTSSITVNNIACFFIYDGYYWQQFYCG